jgi:hypothetical protein
LEQYLYIEFGALHIPLLSVRKIQSPHVNNSVDVGIYTSFRNFIFINQIFLNYLE